MNLPLTTNSIVWQPVIPIGIIIILISLLLYFALKSYLFNSTGILAGTGKLSVIIKLFLLSLRLTAIFAMATILFNPARLVPDSDQKIRQDFYIALDTSKSMCTRDIIDKNEKTTRLDAIQNHWLNEQYLSNLQQLVNINYYNFDEQLKYTDAKQASELAPVGKSTCMAKSITTLMHQYNKNGQITAGILLLGDGHDTTNDNAADMICQTAKNMKIPIYTVTAGTKLDTQDISVRLTSDQPFVYTGQKTYLHAEIDQAGYDNQSVTAILTQNGIKEVDRRTVILNEKSNRIVYTVEPEPMHETSKNSNGLSSFQFQVLPMSDEKLIENNTRYSFIQVTNKHIKIILFENEPYWDTRYLIRTLRADIQVELTTVTGLGRNQRVVRYHPGSAESVTNDDPNSEIYNNTINSDQFTAPINESELYDYDIVILGKGVERWFPDTSAALLNRYVRERGGTLIMARAMPFNTSTVSGRTALNEIENISPVRWADNLIQGSGLSRTLTGKMENTVDFSVLGDTDSILTVMPGMLAQTRINGEKTLSNIWLRTTDNYRDKDNSIQNISKTKDPAAVAHMRAGHGQVLAILTDGLWQWALLPDWYEDLNSVFDIFWMRTIRWLIGSGDMLPGQSVALSLDRLMLDPDQPQIITIQTRLINPDTFQPLLTVVDPDNVVHQLEPGLVSQSSALCQYEIVYNPELEGVYSVNLEYFSNSENNESDQAIPIQTSSMFVVYDNSRELLDVSAQPELMASLADSTGGLVIPYNQPDMLLEHLKKIQSAAITTQLPDTIWDNSWLLSVILFIMGCEWLIRRRSNLL